MLTLSAPRQPLLMGPTRLQPLSRIGELLGHPAVYAKRDDEMGIAIGGNKLRSLEFWLGEALAQSADILLVAGAPISNLCRLTAVAAAMNGLDCIVCLSSEHSATARRDSFLNRVFGAELRYLGPIDDDARTHAVQQVAEQQRVAGRRPYVVGDSAVGALGYALAAEELLRQSIETGADLRHVFLPGSMGPSEAGFIFGNAQIGNPFQVHLVSVEYAKAEHTARIDQILADIAVLTATMSLSCADCPVHWHTGYLGAGYAKPTPGSEATLVELARREGLLLEHIYTAKTFEAFLDRVRDGTIPPSEPACAVHTGGVPALFSQFDWFTTL